MNTKMNLKILAGMAALLTGQGALAGDTGREGHGGVVFMCKDKIKLVDYWEAEDASYPMSLGENPNAPLADLVKIYLDRLSFFESGRADQDRIVANQILSDLEILANDPKSRKTKLVRFTEGKLPFSLDSDEITQPKDCEKRQAVTQISPKVSGDRLLTIDREIWTDPKMTNEMKVFTIFHEINVTRAVILGFDTTTRPARQLNRFIGSPEATETNSVCDYMDQVNNIGMAMGTMNWKDKTFTNRFFLYGDATINSLFFRTCWESTRRLKEARGVRITLPKVGLQIDSVNFDENSNNWLSGSVANGSFYSGNFYQEPNPTKSKVYFLTGGIAYQVVPGSYRILGMSRNLHYIRAFKNKYGIGTADLEFDSDPNSTVKETIHDN